MSSLINNITKYEIRTKTKSIYPFTILIVVGVVSSFRRISFSVIIFCFMIESWAHRLGCVTGFAIFFLFSSVGYCLVCAFFIFRFSLCFAVALSLLLILSFFHSLSLSLPHYFVCYFVEFVWSVSVCALTLAIFCAVIAFS